jgi:hypothetical protein
MRISDTDNPQNRRPRDGKESEKVEEEGRLLMPNMPHKVKLITNGVKAPAKLPTVKPKPAPKVKK